MNLRELTRELYVNPTPGQWLGVASHHWSRAWDRAKSPTALHDLLLMLQVCSYRRSDLHRSNADGGWTEALVEPGDLSAFILDRVRVLRELLDLDWQDGNCTIHALPTIRISGDGYSADRWIPAGLPSKWSRSAHGEVLNHLRALACEAEGMAVTGAARPENLSPASRIAFEATVAVRQFALSHRWEIPLPSPPKLEPAEYGADRAYRAHDMACIVAHRAAVKDSMKRLATREASAWCDAIRAHWAGREPWMECPRLKLPPPMLNDVHVVSVVSRGGNAGHNGFGPWTVVRVEYTLGEFQLVPRARPSLAADLQLSNQFRAMAAPNGCIYRVEGMDERQRLSERLHGNLYRIERERWALRHSTARA